ncbi:MAG: sodium/solute symporter [Coriobacteriales bacterium]|jgi:SSS family solute:Na+ symporter/sodium/proline symporter|nr:sodium/solute symporter [Coriobacteriales bacterium]
MFIKIILVVAFFGVAIAIGLGSRKVARSVEGFVLGGRKVGPWLSAFSYGTSYFSAVIFIGYAGQFGWKFGIAASWIGIGNAILGSLLAWWVLGPRVRRMSQRLQAQTMPDFLGKRYHSRAIRICAALIVFVFLIPYTASVYNGLSRLFQASFGIPFEWCVAAMAVVTCIYVVFGGYMATALNDFVQGIVMLVGIVAVVWAVLTGHGGFASALAQMAQVSDPASGAPAGIFASLFGPDAANLVAVIILTSLGTWAMPQMVSKFYAIKDVPALRKGAFISTAFALVVAGGSYFLGGFGRLFAGQIAYSDGAATGAVGAGTPLFDSIIPTMLQGLPDILVGIVVVLVLSASMSTLSSLVLTSSSTLTLDLIKGNLVKRMDERRQLIWMRVLLVVFIVISAVIAIVQYQNSLAFIAQLMGISWGALAGAFLGPFVWGLYLKRVSRAAVWASFGFGIGLTLLNLATGLIGSSIVCGALTMLASLLIVPLVSLFSKPAVAAETLWEKEGEAE